MLWLVFVLWRKGTERHFRELGNYLTQKSFARQDPGFF